MSDNIRCFFAVSGDFCMRAKSICTKIILPLFLCFITGVTGAMEISERMEKTVTGGDYAAVIHFIAEGEDINAKNRGKTILLMTAKNNDAELVKILLDKGANPQSASFRHNNNRADYSDNSALYFAIEYGNACCIA